jgi:alpha-L-fucosidase
VDELARACRKKGLRIMLYYSQPDWHHPNYVHRPGAFKDLQYPNANDAPDWPRYQKYCFGQVKELVTRYGRIDGIWFDGVHKREDEWQGRRLYRMIKQHQPGALVNDRARWGDFLTPERSLPQDMEDARFEACQSIQKTGWGFVKGGQLFSSAELIDTLARLTSKGGNLLLNVGPRPDGTIPADQTQRMLDVGRWLSRNGQAIYGTTGCRLDTGSPDILASRKDKRLYLLLGKWPGGGRIQVPGLRSAPARARMLATGRSLGTSTGRRGVELSGLPAKPPESSVNVVELQFAAEPRFEEAARPWEPKPLIQTQGRRKVRLTADSAHLQGMSVKGFRLKVSDITDAQGKVRRCITNWWGPEHAAMWRVSAPGRQRCRVSVVLACTSQFAGSRFMVRFPGQRLYDVVRGSENDQTFARQTLGEAPLRRGINYVTLKPTWMNYGYIFANVEAVELEMVE